ncbi:SDR family NAD(P)-dependent oxidoreductase [Ferruginivarius sediminum]|nr:SDR family oxidoreductase [Ferruginivarius sediminum]
MTGELEGQMAWVTGASGAIGRAVCQTFSQAGARLALTGRNADKLADVAASLPAGGCDPIIAPGDVSDAGQVTAAADSVRGQAGRIDILVNSTTCPIFGDFLDLTDADWLSVLDAKALAYVRTARAVIPGMIEAGGGVIVNVSGRGGHQPNSPSHLAGSCANGAVNTLTKGLANLYGPSGIRVNAVAPGPVASERFERIRAANQALAESGGVSERSGTPVASPLGDMAEPAQVADVILFLASKRARFMTGSVLQVDGGGTASL